MSALDTQVGGDHYKSAAIQPVQYIEANGLKFLEGCCLKRITRHDKPTGKGRQDIEKAIHELQLLLELRYGKPADAFADEPLTEAERLDIYNQLQAQARNRPAWPDDKAYRWMAQDADGRWFAYNYKPEKDRLRWVSHPDEAMHITVVGEPEPNANWRDTLIERGADE